MSKIEWTEKTWNPIVGCSIVSPGCTNCYAMLVDRTAAFALRDAFVFLFCIDEHAIILFIDTSDLHSAKAKQINAIQTPTPNSERHSARATKESN